MTVRLHLIVEGQTEKRFVDTVLAPHLLRYHLYADARCVMTSRSGAYWRRGGLANYRNPKFDITSWMKQERANSDVWFSTMFDLYALPEEFPGYSYAQQYPDPYNRVAHLETALAQDIDHRQFAPYIQLHEFEAIILADPQKLNGQFFEHAAAIMNLEAICQNQEPERINDGRETAPSKRIIAEIPEYEGLKSSAGPDVVKEIGLPCLRRKCPHFDKWLARLEALG